MRIVGLLVGWLLVLCSGFSAIVLFFITLADFFSNDSDSSESMVTTIIFAVLWILGGLLIKKCSKRDKLEVDSSEQSLNPSVKKTYSDEFAFERPVGKIEEFNKDISKKRKSNNMRIIGLIIGCFLIICTSPLLVYGIGEIISPTDYTGRCASFIFTAYIVFWFLIGIFILRKCWKKPVKRETIKRPFKQPEVKGEERIRFSRGHSAESTPENDKQHNNVQQQDILKQRDTLKQQNTVQQQNTIKQEDNVKYSEAGSPYVKITTYDKVTDPNTGVHLVKSTVDDEVKQSETGGQNVKSTMCVNVTEPDSSWISTNSNVKKQTAKRKRHPRKK